MDLQVNQANILMDYVIDDPNFKSAEVSINDSERQSIPKQGSLEFNDLENGKYYITMWALDFNNNERVLVDSAEITGVGLEKVLSNENNLKVYPNPVTNDLTAKYSEGKTAIIDTWDINGKQISRVRDDDRNGETQFNFSNYKPGMYLMRVTDEDGMLMGTRKIIKK